MTCYDVFGLKRTLLFELACSLSVASVALSTLKIPRAERLERQVTEEFGAKRCQTSAIGW